MTAPAGLDTAAVFEQLHQHQEKRRIFELFNGEIPTSVPVDNCPNNQPPAPRFWDCPDCDYAFGPLTLNIVYVDHDCPQFKPLVKGK